MDKVSRLSSIESGVWKKKIQTQPSHEPTDRTIGSGRVIDLPCLMRNSGHLTNMLWRTAPPVCHFVWIPEQSSFPQTSNYVQPLVLYSHCANSPQAVNHSNVEWMSVLNSNVSAAPPAAVIWDLKAELQSEYFWRMNATFRGGGNNITKLW